LSAIDNPGSHLFDRLFQVIGDPIHAAHRLVHQHGLIPAELKIKVDKKLRNGRLRGAYVNKSFLECLSFFSYKAKQRIVI
jgi:hypothetical protein